MLSTGTGQSPRPFDSNSLFQFQNKQLPMLDSLMGNSSSCPSNPAPTSSTLPITATTTCITRSGRTSRTAKKAARRPKRKATSDLEEIAVDGESKTERRKRQNRQAAQKSRERKRNLIQDLTDQVQRLESTNAVLENTCRAQQEQIRQLLARLENLPSGDSTASVQQPYCEPRIHVQNPPLTATTSMTSTEQATLNRTDAATSEFGASNPSGILNAPVNNFESAVGDVDRAFLPDELSSSTRGFGCRDLPRFPVLGAAAAATAAVPVSTLPAFQPQRVHRVRNPFLPVDSSDAQGWPCDDAFKNPRSALASASCSFLGAAPCFEPSESGSLPSFEQTDDFALDISLESLFQASSPAPVLDFDPVEFLGTSPAPSASHGPDCAFTHAPSLVT